MYLDFLFLVCVSFCTQAAQFSGRTNLLKWQDSVKSPILPIGQNFRPAFFERYLSQDFFLPFFQKKILENFVRIVETHIAGTAIDCSTFLGFYAWWKQGSHSWRKHKWYQCLAIADFRGHKNARNTCRLGSSSGIVLWSGGEWLIAKLPHSERWPTHDWKQKWRISRFGCLTVLSAYRLMTSFFPFQKGFAGELCNFEYNECESNPCLNNGQCTDHIGGFSCQCTRGYTGKRCHIKVSRQSGHSFPFISFFSHKIFHLLFSVISYVVPIHGCNFPHERHPCIIRYFWSNFYKNRVGIHWTLWTKCMLAVFVLLLRRFMRFYNLLSKRPNEQSISSTFGATATDFVDCAHPFQCLFRCDACAAAITAKSMNLFRSNRTNKNMNTKRFNCSEYEYRIQSLGT